MFSRGLVQIVFRALRSQGRCEAAIETREKEVIPGSTEGPAGD